MDPAGMPGYGMGSMGIAANCVVVVVVVGVSAGENPEPEGMRYAVMSLFEAAAAYPLVPRIGFGPGGRGVEGDGVYVCSGSGGVDGPSVLSFA